MLSGYKTYILAALGVVYAVSAYFTGHMDITTLAQMLEVSLGLGTIRAAVSKGPSA